MIPLSIIPVSGRCNLFRFNMNQYDLIMYLQPSKRYKTFTCAADLRTFPDMCLKWGNRGGFDINSLTFANRLRTRQKIGPHLLIHMNTLMRISALSTTKWQALLHFLSQHLICHSTVHTFRHFWCQIFKFFNDSTVPLLSIQKLEDGTITVADRVIIADLHQRGFGDSKTRGSGLSLGWFLKHPEARHSLLIFPNPQKWGSWINDHDKILSNLSFYQT